MSEQPLSALQAAGENPATGSHAHRRISGDAGNSGHLAILPVRGFVVFPRTVSPLNVQRPASIQLPNETLPQNKIIGLITLRGLVLPIGGLKEKSLAAMRAGITTVIIPKPNEKDLVDIPEEAKQKLQFVPVETVDEVLKRALEQPPSPYEG